MMQEEKTRWESGPPVGSLDSSFREALDTLDLGNVLDGGRGHGPTSPVGAGRPRLRRRSQLNWIGAGRAARRNEDCERRIISEMPCRPTALRRGRAIVPKCSVGAYE